MVQPYSLFTLYFNSSSLKTEHNESTKKPTQVYDPAY
jgi:hypothetical protein